MQRVALLSYHFWYNYGTCLQAYALWKALQNIGIESEYLDFGWRYPMDKQAYWSLNMNYLKPIGGLSEFRFRTRLYLSAIINGRLKKQIRYDRITGSNHRKFDLFHKHHIKQSKPYNELNLKDANQLYSLFMVGSDQTWNPDCCNEVYFKHFLLDFVLNNDKKSAYAPSVGKTTVSDETRNLFRQYLLSFAHLSCRERSGCQIISDATKREVVQVIDPTLLITHEEWLKLSVAPNTKKGYVLCYVLGDRIDIVEDAIEYADSYGLDLKIVTITSSIIEKHHKQVVHNTGPREFLGLIDKSTCVFTDSFHGTAFSLNFGKPFYSYMKREGGYNESDNSRIHDFLSIFGLEDRLVTKKSLTTKSIDFIKIEHIINEFRKNGYTFLRDATIRV